MFPDHFFSMLSQMKQPFDQNQEIMKEQTTDQPQNQPDVPNTAPPDNPTPPNPRAITGKKIPGRPATHEELMFVIETPEINPSPELNNPPPPLPKDKITVRFKYNGDAIIEEDLRKLKAVSKSLVAHPNSKILITGYTDVRENGTYNVKLSEFRATIVKSFLLGLGVKSYQMTIQGRGGQDPIENNDTSWGRMMNRRVEIEVIE